MDTNAAVDFREGIALEVRCLDLGIMAIVASRSGATGELAVTRIVAGKVDGDDGFHLQHPPRTA